MEKVYVVGRADLAPGLRAAQMLHAFHTWVVENPEPEMKWRKESNTIVMLEVPDRKALLDLYHRCLDRSEPGWEFWCEPDLKNEMTAICLGPSHKALAQPLKLAYSRET